MTSLVPMTALLKTRNNVVERPISKAVGDVFTVLSSNGFKDFFINPAKLAAAIFKYTNPAAWAAGAEQPKGVVPALLGVVLFDEWLGAKKIFTDFTKLVTPLATEIVASDELDPDHYTGKREYWKFKLGTLDSEICLNLPLKEALLERIASFAALAAACFDFIKLVNRFFPVKGLIGRALPYVKPVAGGVANVKSLYQDTLFFRWHLLKQDPKERRIEKSFNFLAIAKSIIGLAKLAFELPNIYLGENKPKWLSQGLFHLTVLEGTLALILKAAEHGGYYQQKTWHPAAVSKSND